MNAEDLNSGLLLLPESSPWTLNTDFYAHSLLFYYEPTLESLLLFCIPRESTDFTCFRVICTTRNILLHAHYVNVEFFLSQKNNHWFAPNPPPHPPTMLLRVITWLPVSSTWLNTTSGMFAWRMPQIITPSPGSHCTLGCQRPAPVCSF